MRSETWSMQLGTASSTMLTSAGSRGWSSKDLQLHDVEVHRLPRLELPKSAPVKAANASILGRSADGDTIRKKIASPARPQLELNFQVLLEKESIHKPAHHHSR
ncbi:uncharacterized protein LOC144594695 [Rhinoraja longicauda]